MLMNTSVTVDMGVMVTAMAITIIITDTDTTDGAVKMNYINSILSDTWDLTSARY